MLNETENTIAPEYPADAFAGALGEAGTAQWTIEKVELCGAASASAPARGGTRYLWAGYRYQPPQMGFWVDPPGAPGLGIYGAATGTNRLGQYYCWNRTYDINLGRWTTPDPVATPWWNLFDYVRNRPSQVADIAGLSGWRVVESLSGGQSGGAEDTVGEAAKGVSSDDPDVESNADEGEILDALKKTKKGDVFVYLGHGHDTDGDGKVDTLEEHDGLVTSWLLGGVFGALTCGNDAVDKEKFDKARKEVTGTVLLFGCRGCDIKFPNAECVICYPEEVSMGKALADMASLAKVLEGMKSGSSMTWAQVVAAMNTETGKNFKAAMPKDAVNAWFSEGCKNVKVTKE